MPQMMPINWLMIFFMCLMSLIFIVVLMNFLLMYMKMGNVNSKFLYKKWKWFW
nr:TPA_asm: ATP8 [Bombus balteatus]